MSRTRNALAEAKQAANATQLNLDLQLFTAFDPKTNPDIWNFDDENVRSEARRKLLDDVQELLRKGADANVSNEQGSCPLYYSTGLDPDIIKVLLEGGADLHKCIGDSEITAFMMAVWSKDLETVKAFVDYAKAQDEMVDGDNLKRLMNSADSTSSSIITFATRNQNPEVLSFFLQPEFENLLDEDFNINEALRDALTYGGPENIETLINHGANIDCDDENGRALLFYAIRFNKADVVKAVVLKHNPNINVVDDEGLSPLSNSIAWLKPDLVSFFLDQGVDAEGAIIEAIFNRKKLDEAQTADSNRIIEILVRRNGFTLLSDYYSIHDVTISEIIDNDDIEALEIILREAKEDQVKPIRDKAFLTAAYKGKNSVLKFLLEGDELDLEIINKAAIHAGENGHNNSLQILMDAGEKIDVGNSDVLMSDLLRSMLFAKSRVTTFKLLLDFAGSRGMGSVFKQDLKDFKNAATFHIKCLGSHYNDKEYGHNMSATNPVLRHHLLRRDLQNKEDLVKMIAIADEYIASFKEQKKLLIDTEKETFAKDNPDLIAKVNEFEEMFGDEAFVQRGIFCSISYGLVKDPVRIRIPTPTPAPTPAPTYAGVYSRSAIIEHFQTRQKQKPPLPLTNPNTGEIIPLKPGQSMNDTIDNLTSDLIVEDIATATEASGYANEVFLKYKTLVEELKEKGLRPTIIRLSKYFADSGLDGYLTEEARTFVNSQAVGADPDFDKRICRLMVERINAPSRSVSVDNNTPTTTALPLIESGGRF